MENVSLLGPLSIADLINFESEDLGNHDIQIAASEAAKKLNVSFNEIPISRAIWVTRTFEQAMHYSYDSDDNQIANIMTIEIPENTHVIADLGDDGVLLFLPEQIEK